MSGVNVSLAARWECATVDELFRALCIPLTTAPILPSREIRADAVVNCGGQWAPKLGQMSGVNVPLPRDENARRSLNSFECCVYRQCDNSVTTSSASRITQHRGPVTPDAPWVLTQSHG